MRKGMPDCKNKNTIQSYICTTRGNHRNWFLLKEHYHGLLF